MSKRVIQVRTRDGGSFVSRVPTCQYCFFLSFVEGSDFLYKCLHPQAEHDREIDDTEIIDRECPLPTEEEFEKIQPTKKQKKFDEDGKINRFEIMDLDNE